MPQSGEIVQDHAFHEFGIHSEVAGGEGITDIVEQALQIWRIDGIIDILVSL